MNNSSTRTTGVAEITSATLGNAVARVTTVTAKDEVRVTVGWASQATFRPDLKMSRDQAIALMDALTIVLEA